MNKSLLIGLAVGAAAAAGAGGYAGNRIENRMQRGNVYTTTEQRCATVYRRTLERNGYEVRYRLGGKEGTVRMNHDPGQRIPVAHGQLVLGSGSQAS